ncbi:tRNA (N6-isopentenyl adenosine(37)-C2)-methylthiotransferase MiaB, partial [Klebsiella pneumoniae]
VIPGFPGESDDEFRETLALIDALDLSYLHVFPYSARPNTAALRLPGHLDVSTVKDRASRLRELSAQLATA